MKRLVLKEKLFMNNRGQSLVLFVLIMPLLISFLGFLIDTSKVFYEKNRISGVIESNLHSILINNIRDDNMIKNIFKDNDIRNLYYSVDDDIINIKISISSDSLFGKILSFKFYRYDMNYIGNYMTKEITKG